MLVDAAATPDVLCLVPTLGRDVDRLRRSVEAVAQQTGDHRVAVVCLVNSPETGRVTGLPAEVRVIECGLNLGWGGALAFGRTMCEAAYVWTVQDDMDAAPNCLRHLVAELRARPDLAAVSPAGVGSDGLVPWGSLGGQLDGELQWTWYPPVATRPDNLVGHEEISIVASRGMLVRTTAWDEVGGPDPRLHPVMYSDLSLCLALQRAGWAAVVPAAVVTHDRHGSTTKAFADFIASRNRAVFEASWFPDRVNVDALRPSPPEALDGKLHPDIPAELLASVAQAATDTVLHLGAFHSATVETLTARIAELGVALSDSVTAAAQAQTASEDELRRVSARLRRTRRQLVAARTWKGRLGLG